MITVSYIHAVEKNFHIFTVEGCILEEFTIHIKAFILHPLKKRLLTLILLQVCKIGILSSSLIYKLKWFEPHYEQFMRLPTNNIVLTASEVNQKRSLQVFVVH